MGKIWIKTKYDNTLKADIPHNINFANAMYGFLDLGADVAFYHDINEIYDTVARNMV